MPLFFDSSGQRGEQGASEARKRPSGAFVARCACRGVITPRASLVARSKKEVTTYVVTSFLDSGRELKCSGEVNSPCAKVLPRKTLVRRKSAEGTAWVGMPAPDEGARRCCPDGQGAAGALAFLQRFQYTKREL